MTREPGSTLDGKYEIVQRLGSGGMGEVYLVRHVHLQELRVVKILRQDLQKDEAARKRFTREARLATQIKHPNVAILYDFATLPDDSFYMVWEHIEGQDVGDWIRRNGPFPVPVATRLGIQALRGLEAIHASGVIHRDLSPDNLMITEDKQGQKRIKIIDLGLARTLEKEQDASHEITQVGMFMGKLQYCSPEQASPAGGEPLDRRSDIYSFGLVLYEMIAGLPPFESESQAGFIFKRLSEDPLPLAGRNPKVLVPPELDRVVLSALERDREKRMPDSIRFIQALERVEHGMTGAETREIPVQSFRGAPRPPEPAPAAPAPRQRSTSELTRTEREELLAQIDRASRRVQDTSAEIAGAEAALAAGRLDEAQQWIARAEAANPRAQGLQGFRERLAQEREKAERGERARRVTETEQVLANYIQRKQLALARLALETLTELAPGHLRRAELESSVGHLAEEVERDKRVEAALAAGRAALAGRDVRAARRELEVVMRNDSAGKRAAAFHAEVESAEREDRQKSVLEERRRRLEELISEHRVQDAERELEALSKMEVTRVTVDFYRDRLAAARGDVDREERISFLEMRFRKAVAEQDWPGAREAAMDLGKTDPSSPRAGEMFGEVDRLEADFRRQQSVEQGVRQIESFIEQGDAAKAELALKILLQMDPENRHRKRLEKQVRAMR